MGEVGLRAKRTAAAQGLFPGLRGSGSGSHEKRRRKPGRRFTRAASRKKERISSGFQPSPSKNRTPSSGPNFIWALGPSCGPVRRCIIRRMAGEATSKIHQAMAGRAAKSVPRARTSAGSR